MLFLIFGLAIIALGGYFNIQARKNKDGDGVVGTTMMIIAGLILVFVYGIFYSILAFK
jgi:hypothetical protein